MPPFGKSLVLALQHVFAMFGATILVPILVNAAIASSGVKGEALTIAVALVTAGDRRNFIKNIISKYKSVDVLVIAYNKQLPTIYSNIFEADEIYIVQKTNSNQNDCNKIIKLI